MAIMGFDADTKRMYLKECYEGVSKAAVLDHMGFAVDVSRARTITPPSTEELSILRERCDPQRLILG
jgi:glutaconate CoA-transferase subunit B